jgi:glycosyltransferase involved in cell wall biosynthesis
MQSAPVTNALDNSVTVIIGTYNRATILPRAIRSALAAIQPGDEILVVDDGSTDHTPLVVKEFGDAVRYLRIEKAASAGASSSGLAAVRNLGIRTARCPLVTFLDDDDEWTADKLQLQRAVMARYPDVVFSFCNAFSKLPDGQIAHDVLSIWSHDHRVGHVNAPRHLRHFLGHGVPFSSIGTLPSGREDFAVMVGDMFPAEMEVHWVWGCAVMVRASIAGALFRFPENMTVMEDWAAIAELARIAPAAYLDAELAIQHVHNAPRLTDANDLKQITDRMNLLQRIWGGDVEFQSRHSARYQELLRTLYRLRARRLIGAGRLAEASEDLRRGGGPRLHRLIAAFPPPLVRGAFQLKRKVMKWHKGGLRLFPAAASRT